MPNCTNRVRTDLVRIGVSGMLPGERGLFATCPIPGDTPIADFGPLRELKTGESGKDTVLGYCIPISQSGSSRTWVTPVEGVRAGFVAHVINHTCDPRFQNCGFFHTGDEGEEVKVYVKTLRQVDSDEEFFVDYGGGYLLQWCQCHIHRSNTL